MVLLIYSFVGDNIRKIDVNITQGFLILMKTVSITSEKQNYDNYITVPKKTKTYYYIQVKHVDEELDLLINCHQPTKITIIEK